MDPRQKDFDERHTKLPTVQALTKREYFAAMALQGVIIAKSDKKSYSDIALESVSIADQLLKYLGS